MCDGGLVSKKHTKAAKNPQEKQLQRLWGLAAVTVQFHSPLEALAQNTWREVTCRQRCQPGSCPLYYVPKVPALSTQIL